MKDESSEPWAILGYESWMLERSIQERERLDRTIRDEEQLRVLKNALTESAVLHARTLCEFFTDPEGEFANHIELSLAHLLPDWDWGKPEYESLNGLLSELEEKYGKHRGAHTPRRVFNQMLSFATVTRPSAHNYSAALNSVLPLLQRILAEIQAKQP